MGNIDTRKESLRAVLVGIITKNQTDDEVEEYLEELSFLAETAGITAEKRFTQRLENPDVRYFVGKGKLSEIREYIKKQKIDVIIFDDDLSPSQLRNVEKELKIKIYDRSLLILDIFLLRAGTSRAKTQVELARSQYLLPRLTRMWTHLERQRGGTGTRGGAGEKEIETDRRIIRTKIAKLSEKLEKIEKQQTTQRKSRKGMVRVALVGYTNAGKSTLMNLLSKSDVFAEDKLFATLDTTVRKVVINNLPFLLSDTVGFIRKLPHQLVESFKSTLDEVRESDYLVHVVDVSHPNFESHIETVNQTLSEIIDGEKPSLLVFNKIDAYDGPEEDVFDETGHKNHSVSLKSLKGRFERGMQKCIFISATNKIGIDELKKLIYREIRDIHAKKYPYNNFLY